MRKMIVVFGVALVLVLMAGCGGGGNSGGGGTPPPPPPPPPTPTALTVTVTPVKVDIDQTSQPASGSLFVGQQATIAITQGTATVTNATVTASAGTISQSTFTAPATSGSVTISAKGTDGATGSATVNVVKPTAPTVVASAATDLDYVPRSLFLTDANTLVGAGVKAGNQGIVESTVFTVDTSSLKIKKTEVSQELIPGAQMQKIVAFGGRTNGTTQEPYLASFDSTPAVQKTSSCGFNGSITGTGYDPSMNAIWLAISTPSQSVLALADAVSLQINCSSVYLIMDGGQVNTNSVIPFSGGLLLVGTRGGMVAPLGQTLPGSAETFVILMDRNGNKLHETHYNNSSSSRPFIGSSVAAGPVDENGATFFYVAGSKLLSNGANIWLQKFDANANPVWVNPYEFSGDISPSVGTVCAMIPHPKGGMLLVGESTRPSQAVVMLDFNLTDAIIAGVKSDGSEYWKPARFNRNTASSPYNKASFRSVRIDTEGFAWVGGPFIPWQNTFKGSILKVALP